MSVSSISPSDSQYSTAVQDAATQRRLDAQALANALKQGDLAAAQKAFGDLQNLQSSPTNQGASGQSTAQSTNIQSLATALKSGDLSGAQAAFAAVQKGHHGHHHHAKGVASPTAAASSASNTDSDAAAQLLGTMVNAKA
jgi:ribosomal protein S20